MADKNTRTTIRGEPVALSVVLSILRDERRLPAARESVSSLPLRSMEECLYHTLTSSNCTVRGTKTISTTKLRSDSTLPQRKRNFSDIPNQISLGVRLENHGGPFNGKTTEKRREATTENRAGPYNALHTKSPPSSSTLPRNAHVEPSTIPAWRRQTID